MQEASTLFLQNTHPVGTFSLRVRAKPLIRPPYTQTFHDQKEEYTYKIIEL